MSINVPMSLAQRANVHQCLFYDTVQPLDLLLPDLFLRCFQDDGHVVEAGIVHHADKDLHAQIALTDAFMSVDPWSRGLFWRR